MRPYDPFNDAAPIVDVHTRLAYIVDDRELRPTTEDLQNDTTVGILSFPTETLEYLFQFLSRDRDLAQVCKVCKRFFATALPLLYGNLHIDIKAQMDVPVLQMLTRENTGMQFVRFVYTYPEKGVTANSGLFHQSLQIVINHLPVNQLRSFHWCSSHALPSALVRDLWQRQRNLRYLEIVPFSPPRKRTSDGEDDCRSQLQAGNFPNLYAVQATVDTLSSAQTANAALQCSNITSLKVDALAWTGADPFEYRPPQTNPSPDDDEDSNHGSASDDNTEVDPEFPVIDALTATLFSHLPRVQPGIVPPTSNLTRLTLKDINLTLSKHTWCTFLDLHSLIYLKIKYCKGADMFLLNLSHRFPALEFMELVHYLANQADRTVHALDDFIGYQPVLQLHTLKICLRNTNQLPSAVAIAKHHRSLQRLMIDVACKTWADPTYPPPPPDTLSRSASPAARQIYARPCYPHNDFKYLVDKCEHLIELAIDFPPYDLHFETFDPDRHDENCALVLHTETTIRALPHLCTLNILNWPQHYQPHKPRGYYAAKNAALARLAAAIFQRSRNFNRTESEFDDASQFHRGLEVVAFGLNERSCPRAVYFLPAQVTTLAKKPRLGAEIAEWTELWEHALEIEVLDGKNLDFDKACRKGPHESRGGAWRMDALGELVWLRWRPEEIMVEPRWLVGEEVTDQPSPIG